MRSVIQDAMLFPALHAVCRANTVGTGNLADLDGPFLLVANHVSHLDCPVLLGALPRRLRRRTTVVAAADYFYRSRLLGTAVTVALGAMPVERKMGAATCLRPCAQELAAGRVLMIFPEGTRSRDGRLATFRRGAALLAIRAKVPIVPVGISGLYEILPAGCSMPHRGRVNVCFGAPLRPRPSERAAALAGRMEEAVAALCRAEPNEPIRGSRALVAVSF